MSKLEKLRELNIKPSFSVNDKQFESYGRVLSGYDFSEMLKYISTGAEMPECGNVYKASVPELENTEIFPLLEKTFYGGMRAQAGFCNGKNSTMNGFEYHKGSEINAAATDFVLLLGHTWDIASDNTYEGEKSVAFFVPKGTAVELYETTLHLSPCKVSDEGFRAVVILPKGTNTPLEYEKSAFDKRDELLLQRNKWVIAHPNRIQLISQGAFAGVTGENYEYRYE